MNPRCHGSAHSELESELLSNREYMQSIIEEQEATNEELQSANEEIQSANEELQSTNEELETAKEELQSTNEELATINEEHENRNQELMSCQQRPDQSAGQRGTGDRDPARRHEHPALHADSKITAQPDRCRRGRPIGNIRPNVTIPDLEKRVQQVIAP